jgi:3-phosphoshikimate 1-carboxyvinyltransferase
VAGLAVPGITIANPQCVEKSFPTFWDVFEGLYSI